MEARREASSRADDHRWPSENASRQIYSSSQPFGCWTQPNDEVTAMTSRPLPLCPNQEETGRFLMGRRAAGKPPRRAHWRIAVDVRPGETME